MPGERDSNCMRRNQRTMTEGRLSSRRRGECLNRREGGVTAAIWKCRIEDFTDKRVGGTMTAQKTHLEGFPGGQQKVQEERGLLSRPGPPRRVSWKPSSGGFGQGKNVITVLQGIRHGGGRTR